MEILRIEWETGYMELSVKAFFPCKLLIAKKIAPLINRYCTEEDRAALLSELRDMARYYQQEILGYKNILREYSIRYAAIGSMSKSEANDEKYYETKVRKTEALKKRAERNIDLIEGGKKK